MKGDFRKSFIPLNRRSICEVKCIWKQNFLVSAKKKIPIEQRKQTVDTGTKDYKEYHQDFINENEVTKKCKYIQ